jgi:hypothetical protein|tara:strand:+ start:3894 stop:4451 length:558 start_codon:yes stop_codon:yes gene_type:complete
MVAPTNFNEQIYRGKAFEGFVQFQIPDGSTWYRMKERQSMTLSMNYTRSAHYSDSGQKVVDPAGFSHSFSMDIKLTSDMFSNTAWTYTGGVLDKNVSFSSADKKTLSYWLYKNEINQPIDMIFVTSFPTLTAPSPSTNDDVNIKIHMDPNVFSTGLSASGGVPELNIKGDVLSITHAVRSTTTEQ